MYIFRLYFTNRDKPLALQTISYHLGHSSVNVHCRPNLSNFIPLKIISVVNFDLLQFKRDRLQLQLRNSKLLLTI